LKCRIIDSRSRRKKICMYKQLCHFDRSWLNPNSVYLYTYIHIYVHTYKYYTYNHLKCLITNSRSRLNPKLTEIVFTKTFQHSITVYVCKYIQIVNIFLYIYTYIYTCRQVHTHVCTYILSTGFHQNLWALQRLIKNFADLNMYTYMRTYIGMYAHIHVHIDINIDIKRKCTMYMYIDRYMYMYIYIYIYVYTHTYVYM